MQFLVCNHSQENIRHVGWHNKELLQNSFVKFIQHGGCCTWSIHFLFVIKTLKWNLLDVERHVPKVSLSRYKSRKQFFFSQGRCHVDNDKWCFAVTSIWNCLVQRRSMYRIKVHCLSWQPCWSARPRDFLLWEINFLVIQKYCIVPALKHGCRENMHKKKKKKNRK